MSNALENSGSSIGWFPLKPKSLLIKGEVVIPFQTPLHNFLKFFEYFYLYGFLLSSCFYGVVLTPQLIVLSEEKVISLHIKYVDEMDAL